MVATPAMQAEGLLLKLQPCRVGPVVLVEALGRGHHSSEAGTGEGLSVVWLVCQATGVRMRCTVHSSSTHGAAQCMRQWFTCALVCIWCGPWQSAELLQTGMPMYAVRTAANKQDAQAFSGWFTGNACKGTQLHAYAAV